MSKQQQDALKTDELAQQEEADEDQEDQVDQSVGRLPIFSKNTDFSEEDYRLKSLGDDQQPKRFLKSKSPMKAKLFLEDGEDQYQQQEVEEEDEEGVGEYQSRNQQDSYLEGTIQEEQLKQKQHMQDQEEIRSEKGHTIKDEDASKIGIGMVVSRKTPLRESRKERGETKSSQGVLTGDNYRYQKHTSNGDDQEFEGDEALDSQRSQKFKEFINDPKNRSQSNMSGALGSGSYGGNSSIKYGGGASGAGGYKQGANSLHNKYGAGRREQEDHEDEDEDFQTYKQEEHQLSGSKEFDRYTLSKSVKSESPTKAGGAIKIYQQQSTSFDKKEQQNQDAEYSSTGKRKIQKEQADMSGISFKKASREGYQEQAALQDYMQRNPSAEANQQFFSDKKLRDSQKFDDHDERRKQYMQEVQSQEYQEYEQKDTYKDATRNEALRQSSSLGGSSQKKQRRDRKSRDNSGDKDHLEKAAAEASGGSPPKMVSIDRSKKKQKDQTVFKYKRDVEEIKETVIKKEKNLQRTEVREKSKLKDLEEQLRKSILENPKRPLDYALLHQLQEEAARVIQYEFKLRKKRREEEEEVIVRGRFCERKVQTDPVNLYKLGALTDKDKFKKFFFAVFYTYLMMNSIMADAFKKQQQH